MVEAGSTQGRRRVEAGSRRARCTVEAGATHGRRMVEAVSNGGRGRWEGCLYGREQADYMVPSTRADSYVPLFAVFLCRWGCSFVVIVFTCHYIHPSVYLGTHIRIQRNAAPISIYMLLLISVNSLSLLTPLHSPLLRADGCRCATYFVILSAASGGLFTNRELSSEFRSA